jgi:hypothetical protein
MTKFDKFESAIIIDSLNFARSSDLANHQKVVDAGKNPIMTADYIQQTYDVLTQKVKELTKKR